MPQHALGCPPHDALWLQLMILSHPILDDRFDSGHLVRRLKPAIPAQWWAKWFNPTFSGNSVPGEYVIGNCVGFVTNAPSAMVHMCQLHAPRVG